MRSGGAAKYAVELDRTARSTAGMLGDVLKMKSLGAMAGTISAPLSTFRALAMEPRALVAMLLIIAAHLAVPLALSGRLALRQQVLTAQGPKLADMTDGELDDAVVQARKLAMVKVTAGALVQPPLLALELAIALWLWARYLGGKPTFRALYALCTHAQIPLALRSLATAVVVHRQAALTPRDLPALLPSGLAAWAHGSAPVARALGGADFFLLWTGVLLAVALHAASKLSLRRSALGMGLAYVAFVAVFLVGLPGLAKP